MDCMLFENIIIKVLKIFGKIAITYSPNDPISYFWCHISHILIEFYQIT